MTLKSVVVPALFLADLAVPAKSTQSLGLHGVRDRFPAEEEEEGRGGEGEGRVGLSQLVHPLLLLRLLRLLYGWEMCMYGVPAAAFPMTDRMYAGNFVAVRSSWSGGDSLRPLVPSFLLPLSLHLLKSRLQSLRLDSPPSRPLLLFPLDGVLAYLLPARRC